MLQALEPSDSHALEVEPCFVHLADRATKLEWMAEKPSHQQHQHINQTVQLKLQQKLEKEGATPYQSLDVGPLSIAQLQLDPLWLVQRGHPVLGELNVELEHPRFCI